MFQALGQALGFWWWFLPKEEPKSYYYAWVSGSEYGFPVLPSGGFVKLTHKEAENWRVDLMEEYWGANVGLFRWDESTKRWAAG